MRDTAGRAEFDAFFRAQYGRVVRVCFLMTGDRQAAEDAAQEGFVQALVRWAKISRYDRPDAWVRRVAVRSAARPLRARWRKPQSASADRLEVTEREETVDLRRAVATLPRAMRAAVVLHYYEDRPVSEVAEILGCRPSTARVHLLKGRERLRVLLGGKAGDHVE